MKVKGLNIADTNPTVNIGETYQITTNLITDAEDKTITYVPKQAGNCKVARTVLALPEISSNVRGRL